jgi:acetylornithine deacetylase/succinyl-diaminopimelate desuccinylase-like protein
MKRNNLQDAIDKYIDSNQEAFIESLAQLCAVPSVSADRASAVACAQVVAQMLEEYGYQAEIIPTDGNPVVFGESSGSGDFTLLLYLHYDVQPAEKLELWNSPPFELTRKDDKLYGRGAADDKGHIVSRLAALAAVRHAMGELPCNVKFIIEGEEELGSPNLAAFIEGHKDKLAADGCIWEFGGVDHDGAPVQSLGMRGICYVELSVKTAEHDAHSGLGGSIFPNSAWRLIWALNNLKGPDERILIPGFYDNVRPPSEVDLKLLGDLPDQTEQAKTLYGLREFLLGMTGGVELERRKVFEPTCTICGLESGYQGPGTKTIIPAQATAKVDFRLVPEQTPDEIVEKLRAHLDVSGFDDVEIRRHGSTRPAKTDPEDPFILLVNEAARAAYGREPVVHPIIGGSGPSYPFVHGLKLPVSAAGVGYPGSGAHAPNEHIRIADFIRGTRHTAYIVEALKGVERL